MECSKSIVEMIAIRRLLKKLKRMNKERKKDGKGMHNKNELKVRNSCFQGSVPKCDDDFRKVKKEKLFKNNSLRFI